MAGKQLDIAVELRPHIGQRNTPLGLMDVEHDQWIVIVGINGGQPKQVGYLPKREGAPLLLLSTVEERCGAWIVEQIREAVAAKRAEVSSE